MPGGGVAYLRAMTKLDGLKPENEDQETGIEIIRRALEEPIRQIVANTGVEPSVVVNKVKEGKDDFGFNAFSEQYENLLKAGVIDPTKTSGLQSQRTLATIMSESLRSRPSPCRRSGIRRRGSPRRFRSFASWPGNVGDDSADDGDGLAVVSCK